MQIGAKGTYMTVYGFVGPSGTGKSHHALEVAKRLGVQCIVDDGLLIRENVVLAGVSAKREASRIASVRRALFTDKPHAASVRAALASSGAQSVMVLGTSVHMADEIAKHLGLPPISKYIDISEVASQHEIEAAREVRKTEGKHVIPVPTFALKKEFSGYFLEPLRRLVRRGRKAAGDARGAGDSRGAGETGERTVVRPTFSYLGSYTISRAAIEQLICCIVVKTGGIAGVVGTGIEFSDAGLSVDLSVSVRYGARIHEALGEAVERLRAEMDRQASLHIRKVSITAKAIEFAGDA